MCTHRVCYSSSLIYIYIYIYIYNVLFVLLWLLVFLYTYISYIWLKVDSSPAGIHSNLVLSKMAPKMAMKAMKSRMQARMVMPNGKHKAKGKGKSEGMDKAKAKGKGNDKTKGKGTMKFMRTCALMKWLAGTMKGKAKGKGKSEGMGKAKAKGKGQNKGDGDGSDDDFDIVGCFCDDDVLKAFLRRGLINHLPFEDMLAEFHWRLSAPSCPGCLLKHC